MSRLNPSLGWFATEGAAFPMGATWIPQEQAFNFALYSRNATAVTLLLFRSDELQRPILTLTLNRLTNKSGRVWHCRLPEKELRGASFYGYHVDGSNDESSDAYRTFDMNKVMLDPYAKEVYFPDAFDRSAAMCPGSNMGKAPLGVLSKNGHNFDWGDDTVPFHEHDLVIYELHVRGFTANPNSGVTIDRRGTFLGLIDKIPYLTELGVTAVELMPVFQFDPQEGNYWGYMPLNFFAPHSSYASNSRRAAEEFRTMVKSFHAAGIEVFLDVVFNHTGEGNEFGPCYSFKGIDNSTYYIVGNDPAQPYSNYSGTGNTLNTKNRQVGRMILDSMRSWVQQYHVDGFRFDLASVFNRHADGRVSTDDSRLVGAIRADPILGNVRLIAEPWDAAGLQELGTAFPGRRWFQWNARFRDDIRRFVKGDSLFVSGTMMRLYGSDDLFPDTLAEACHPYQSVNYVNSHDGFTLYDQVAYNNRHNWANGEDNRDGHQDNHSWNCGWEGDDNVPEDVVKLRVQQAKNFCCLMMLANGTPMFRAGDEFLQTQQGNNNPYNQDNELSWIDWDRLKTHRDYHRFFRLMIAFRKSHRTIARSRFWREDVSWFGTGPDLDWSHDSHHFAYQLDGSSQQDVDLYVMINAEPFDLTFEIQSFEPGQWSLVVDTSQASPDDIFEEDTEPQVTSRFFQVRASSIVILRS